MKRVTVEKTVRFTLSTEDLRKRFRVPGATFTVVGMGDQGAFTIGETDRVNVEYTVPVKPRGEKAE